ncbi:MAG TPA: PepSY-like domain-containing protein [Chitinophagaceae bacterium]|jgi:hypothetical protein|nr:PepSY-like domain-containing protein [Chitinophagaceae bacterium]
MKKITGLTMISAFVSLTACTQKIDISKVPATIKESFARQFPGITARWEKEDGKYEAGFKQDGHEMSALFDSNGVMTESEIEIELSELPANVKEYIKTRYNGASIKETAKIILPGGKTQYEAEIKGRDIIFDSQGNFIKEVAH